MQLFLTDGDGYGQIPCPKCSSPLLLGLNRKGRWLVGYLTGFRIRPGGEGMLVCPDLDCGHVETASIVSRPDDAVVFNPWSAASHVRYAHLNFDKTLEEVWAEVLHLKERFEKTADPRIPSLFRFKRDRYRWKYWDLQWALRGAQKHKIEVLCQGKDWQLQGRIMTLAERGLLVEPTEPGDAVYISLGTLKSATQVSGTLFHKVRSDLRSDRRCDLRFDFGGEGGKRSCTPDRNLPGRFAVVGGHSVELVSISTGGVCRVASREPLVARALHLWSSGGGPFTGEVPAALVERVYRVARYAYLNGHRAQLVSDLGCGRVRIETRNLEVARALQMNRYLWDMRRKLRWWKECSLTDITLEVVEIPDRLPRRLRQAR